MEGSQHADAAQTFGGSCCSRQEGRAGDSEQPDVTRGLWLTNGLEHMVDTLLGTSRLVGERRTLQGESFFHLKHLC